MPNLRCFAHLIGAALLLAAPINAKAASVTIDLFLPLFSEEYQSGDDPFGVDEPASAEITITFDDEAPETGGFSFDDVTSSEFEGSVSSYSITVRDSADTSGNILGTLSAAGGSVADLFTEDNIVTEIGPRDVFLFTADISTADTATGALAAFGLFSITAVFSSDSFSSAGLENVTQENFDQASVLPNLQVDGSPLPALFASLTRILLIPVDNSLQVNTDAVVFGNNIAAIPLPPAGALLIATLIGLGALRRRYGSSLREINAFSH